MSSPDYGPAGTINNNIASGLAFFVQSNGEAGKVIFTEKSKASANEGIAMRQQSIAGSTIELSTSLYGVNASGTAFITDGTLQLFSPKFSNAVDGLDTRKLSNTSENLSVQSGGKDLVIERRNLPTEGDTILYHLSGILNQNYRLVFNASGLSNAGVEGFIEDSYTNTETPLNLNGNTEVNFTANSVAASKAAGRFYIVFKTMEAMPVTVTSVKATAKNTTVAVQWTVENQSNMKEYDVERSGNGKDFVQAGVVKANNTATSVYNWLDEQPFSGTNFYRIRTVDLNGKTTYTQIVKAEISKVTASISLFPNPAVSPLVHLQLNNAVAGVYYVNLVNPLGQVIVSKKIVHAAGSSVETIRWNPGAPHGVYELEITLPTGNEKTITVKY